MKGYDEKCLELAKHFIRNARASSEALSLVEEQRLMDELAQEIQDAVEAFMQVNHL